MVRTEYKYHTLGGFGRSISHSRKGREGKWRTYLVGRRSAVEGKAAPLPCRRARALGKWKAERERERSAARREAHEKPTNAARDRWLGSQAGEDDSATWRARQSGWWRRWRREGEAGHVGGRSTSRRPTATGFADEHETERSIPRDDASPVSRANPCL